MRLVVIAGIPDVLSQDFARARKKEIEENKRTIIWSALSIHKKYSLAYTSRIYEKFLKAVCKVIQEDPNKHSPLDITALVIYVDYPNSNSESIVATFFPEALAISITPPDLPFPHDSPNKKKAATNVMVERIRDAIRIGERALSAIQKEVSSRANRTPILLPVRNFSIDLIGELLDEVRVRTLEEEEPFQAVAAVTRGFERNNPRKVLDGHPNRHFVNPRGLVFKSPGRSRHAIAQGFTDGYQWRSCLVRARLRLGAPFDPGFHYDCEKLTGKLPPAWRSCHRQEFLTPPGRRHVNIAPNDNVR